MCTNILRERPNPSLPALKQALETKPTNGNEAQTHNIGKHGYASVQESLKTLKASEEGQVHQCYSQRKNISDKIIIKKMGMECQGQQTCCCQTKHQN